MKKKFVLFAKVDLLITFLKSICNVYKLRTSDSVKNGTFHRIHFPTLILNTLIFRFVGNFKSYRPLALLAKSFSSLKKHSLYNLLSMQVKINSI